MVVEIGVISTSGAGSVAIGREAKQPRFVKDALSPDHGVRISIKPAGQIAKQAALIRQPLAAVSE